MKNPQFLQSSPLLLLALSPLFIASCGGSHGHGTVSSSAPVFDEREPNDDPFFGDFIGAVDPDTHLFVLGDVDDDPGPWGDIYDHFEFVTTDLASFEVRLESNSVWNDVALGVFDPDSGEMVLWVDDPTGFHWADFTVHEANKAFVLVVAATWGYGSYELELLGHTFAPLTTAAWADPQGSRPTIEAHTPSQGTPPFEQLAKTIR
ncbi:MAG: hypothetical protein ACI87O_000268 [Planctomycetota bacterium]|jgi:hypothetical protein